MTKLNPIINQNDLGGYLLLAPDGKVIYVCNIDQSVARLIQIKQQLAKHHIMTDLITLDQMEFSWATKQLNTHNKNAIYQFTDQYDHLFSIRPTE